MSDDDDGVTDDGGSVGVTGAAGEKTFKTAKNIIKDLEKYELPEDVKYQANDIFLRMNPKTHRSKKNVQRLFYCTYRAYKELDLVINFTDLCAIFKLNKGDGLKALKLFSPLQTGYMPTIKTYTAVDFIKSVSSELNFSDETIEDITKLARSILEKHKQLNDKTTIFLTKAIIKYYIQINGLDVNFITTPTINNICKIIIELENQ
jgi:transcription initiation factor TFIIIB Brf1 subunit/transcription initiation factor TFIIB